MWYALQGTDQRPDGEVITKTFGVTKDRKLAEQSSDGLRQIVCTPLEIVEMSDAEAARYALLV